MQRKKRNHQNGLEKIREAHEKVAKEELGRLGIVQEMLRKSTDVLRRIIAPVGGRGGVILSFYEGEHPTGFWWCSRGTNEEEAKVFSAHAVPQGLDESLIDCNRKSNI